MKRRISVDVEECGASREAGLTACGCKCGRVKVAKSSGLGQVWSEFLRDLVAREVIILRHVPGSTMLADLLTKATSRQIFVALIKLLDAFPVNGVASWQGSMHASLALMRA